MLGDNSYTFYYSLEFLAVILPLVAVVSSLMIRGELFVKFITTCSVILSSLMSWYLFFYTKETYIINLFSWIEVYKLKINWAIYIDSLTRLMFIVVTTVSSIVHIYSIGYMVHDRGIKRFFMYLSLFTFFMLVLVSSSNFIQLFFGWEGVGICSYLLIGFWYERFAACKSALKAFIINRIGDLFLLLGIVLLFWNFGSLNFNEIFIASNSVSFIRNFSLNPGMNIIDLICILLFVGCMGKSAQIGLHSWLPDAMEGPTPASALIHAATMVTAGVFLMARCSPLFEISVYSRDVVVIIGVLTCFFAATIALVQSDIKKIIAYSTCSQLGYMFIACGVSAYDYAIFHLMTHAFFKALLFLCAGNVIHSFSGEQNIFRMGGGCYKKLPYTYSFMFIASLALSGIFPFAGFYSKDLIIESLGNYNSLFYFLANFVAFLTAFYSWRLIILVFHVSNTKKLVHESSMLMIIPLLVLVVGSMFAGFWGKNILHIDNQSFWNGSIKVIEHHEEQNIVKQLLPLFASLFGIVVAYCRYSLNFCSNLKNNFILNFLCKKWYFDEIYRYLIVLPFSYLAKTLYNTIETKVIDRFGPTFVARCVVKFARNSVKLQTGMIFDYAFIMFLSIIAFIFFIIYSSFS